MKPRYFLCGKIANLALFQACILNQKRIKIIVVFSMLQARMALWKQASMGLRRIILDSKGSSLHPIYKLSSISSPMLPYSKTLNSSVASSSTRLSSVSPASVSIKDLESTLGPLSTAPTVRLANGNHRSSFQLCCRYLTMFRYIYRCHHQVRLSSLLADQVVWEKTLSFDAYRRKDRIYTLS